MKLVIYSTCRPINPSNRCCTKQPCMSLALEVGRWLMQWVVVCLFICLYACFFFFAFGSVILPCDDASCSSVVCSWYPLWRAIWMIFWPLNYIYGVCMHNVHSGYLECVKALIKAKADMCLFSAVGVFTRRALLSLLLCFCLRSYLPSCWWVGVCIASFC